MLNYQRVVPLDGLKHMGKWLENLWENHGNIWKTSLYMEVFCYIGTPKKDIGPCFQDSSSMMFLPCVPSFKLFYLFFWGLLYREICVYMEILCVYIYNVCI